jgi:hypothetical protein
LNTLYLVKQRTDLLILTLKYVDKELEKIKYSEKGLENSCIFSKVNAAQNLRAEQYVSCTTAAVSSAFHIRTLTRLTIIAIKH